VKARYELGIVGDITDDKYHFAAVSGKVAGVKFYFVVQARGGRDGAVLDSLSGTASVLLPDYVGLKFSEIPGFVMDRGNGGRIWDSVGYFTINFADVNETAMDADDEVYVSG
jgi:hypothetical protein